jgi:hypothetical protein
MKMMLMLIVLSLAAVAVIILSLLALSAILGFPILLSVSAKSSNNNVGCDDIKDLCPDNDKNNDDDDGNNNDKNNTCDNTNDTDICDRFGVGGNNGGSGGSNDNNDNNNKVRSSNNNDNNDMNITPAIPQIETQPEPPIQPESLVPPANMTIVDTPRFLLAENKAHLNLQWSNETSSESVTIPKSSIKVVIPPPPPPDGGTFTHRLDNQGGGICSGIVGVC